MVSLAALRYNQMVRLVVPMQKADTIGPLQRPIQQLQLLGGQINSIHTLDSHNRLGIKVRIFVESLFLKQTINGICKEGKSPCLIDHNIVWRVERLAGLAAILLTAILGDNLLNLPSVDIPQHNTVTPMLTNQQPAAQSGMPSHAIAAGLCPPRFMGRTSSGLLPHSVNSAGGWRVAIHFGVNGVSKIQRLVHPHRAFSPLKSRSQQFNL
mmetsp:Transcript_107437/g.245944  ORF Transcript_107437/g.245944 Transcript_107437/m.245944 type:complete len:210 (-) Transcript_107437:186-815(-)